MRFRLRTLMIVLAIGPPVLAVLWIMSVAIHRHFWAVDRGYNFARPLTEEERAKIDAFNKLIDQVQAYEENPEYPNKSGINVVRE